MPDTRVPTAKIFPTDLARALNAVNFGNQPLTMSSSDATARILVETTTGEFGADLLRFPAGGRVPMHTHVGDHVLIVIRGDGVLKTGGDDMSLEPGLIYLVESNVPHEIVATTELVLIAIGNDRRPPESAERLTLCAQ
jgi:quercetin dioxygenase-like cupin family protein